MLYFLVFVNKKGLTEGKKSVLFSVLLGCVVFTSSCATTSKEDAHVDTDRFETYNRAVFKFNYEFDKAVLKPTAKGYRAITTESVRNRISNAFLNMKEPLYTVNNALQGKFKDSGTSLSRFVINTTLGLLGTFDVAEGWGLPRERATFDQTLAGWCVPDGPFVMLPFIGPSTPRAATSLVFDLAMDPVYWATRNDANVKDKINYTYTALEVIALREQNLELLDELERGTVDFYSAMRSTYLQNRSKMGCRVNSDTQTYDFDFEEDAAFDEMEENN